MKRLISVFSLALLVSVTVFADNVPQDRAEKVAQAFWRASSPARVSSPALQLVRGSESGAAHAPASEAPAFYVFDNTSGPGFVIVSGDDVAMPVLGYSFDNEFPQDGTLPPNLQEWLDGVRDNIIRARRDKVEPLPYVSEAWNAAFESGTPVVELKTAEWDQSEPYNLLCPTYSGYSTYTGCAATAMAIVMRYHQWPERGSGVIGGYQTRSYNIYVPEVTLGHAYDWANMPLSYSDGYSEVEADAVAVLMRDCGVSLQSDYGPESSVGTGAYSSDLGTTLITYFGYDRSARYISRSMYTTADWNRMMQEELNNERPILYSGHNSGGGHAFVLDGYTSDNYYSVNWGWSGAYNGYFLLTAMDPAGQGAGGTDAGYNESQGATIGVQRDMGGSPVEEIRYQEYVDNSGRYFNGLAVDGPIGQNEPFNLSAGLVTNNGSMTFFGEILFALTDKDGQIVESLFDFETGEEGLPVAYGYCPVEYVEITSPIKAGYRIRGYYRSENAQEWTVIKGNEEGDCVWDLIIVEDYTIEEITSVSYDRLSKLLRLDFSAGGVSVSLKDASGRTVNGVWYIDGDSTCIDTSRLTEGVYFIELRKDNEIKTLEITI